MRERDRLFKRYCNKNDPTLKVAKHKKYKNARNAVIFKVKRILPDLFSKAFKKPGMATNSLMVNGNVTTNKNFIAEIVNDFFVDVGSILASRIPQGKRPFKTYLRKCVVNSFFINPV